MNLQNKDDVRNYLQQYGLLVSRKKALQNAIDFYRAQSTRSTSVMRERVQSSPQDDAMAKQLLHAMACEDKLEQVKQDVQHALTERLRLIESLPDERYKTLLTWRYITLAEFPRIAYEMHYSLQSLYNLHAIALQSALEVTKKEAC